jgi:putative membrane protein
VATRGTRNVDFLREQLALGEKQVGLARLAAERAARPEVKQFAEALVRDHQQAADELRQIASSEQVNAATQGEQLKTERERLSGLKGAQFDREYLDEIIADHQDAVGDLEGASKGDDPEMRQWAAKHLPMVQRRLEEARQLRAAK